MQTKPTLAEWRLTNPGKSLNEYYAEHGTNVPASPIFQPQTYQSVPAYQQPIVNERIVYVEQRSSSVDVFALVASGVAVVAFFMPWVTVAGGLMNRKQFGSVSPSGYPRLLTFLANMNDQYNTNETENLVLFTPWLLIVLPLLSLLCAMGKATTLRVISCYLYVVTAAYWLYFTYHISEAINDNYGASFGQMIVGIQTAREMGFTIGCIAAMLMLMDGIQAPWGKSK